jgi:glycosyltransferase involved in cell wall biosynthesis
MSDRRLRTLTAFHIGGIGGPQRSLTQAMGWLAERGDVEFLVPEHGETEAEYSAIGPVTVCDYQALTYARGIRGGTRVIRRQRHDIAFFRAEIRRRRPDLVVAVTTVLPALLVAARLERVPTIVFAAELYDQEWKSAPLLRLWGELLARATAVLSDGIVCCSSAVAQQFPRRGRQPVVVAYPPIGLEYAAGERDAGRRRYGLDGAQPCLAVVGSISRGRGQDVALRAFAHVRERFSQARMVIAGAPHPRAVDLAYAQELHELAGSLGIADAVVFADPSASGSGPKAMADLYAAVDVVVNPARFAEPFGRVAPEALVAERPVVATRVGGIPEVIRDGIDGLLVPRDDPEALAVAVERVLDDPEGARELVASGRRAVLEKFGYEQDLAAWKTVLEVALRRPAGRRARLRR